MIENKTILKMDGTVDGEKIEITVVNKPFNGDSDIKSKVVAEMYADLFIDIERAAKRLSYNLGVGLYHHIPGLLSPRCVSAGFYRFDTSVVAGDGGAGSGVDGVVAGVDGDGAVKSTNNKQNIPESVVVDDINSGVSNDGVNDDALVRTTY